MDIGEFHYFEFPEVACDVPGKNGISERALNSFWFQMLSLFLEFQRSIPSDWTAVGEFRKILLFRVLGSGLWCHRKKWNFWNTSQKLRISTAENFLWVPMIISQRLDSCRWILKNLTISSSEKWPMTSPEEMEFLKYRSEASNFNCSELFMSPNDWFRAIGRL